MTTLFKTTIKATLTVAMLAISVSGAVVALPGAAHAAKDTCEGATIIARNRVGQQIRIIDIDWYDYGKQKWRSQPLQNFHLQAGKSKFFTYNLKRVNEAYTKIRVVYRKLDNRGDYKVYGEGRSRKLICNNGSKRFEVFLND